MQYFDKNGVEIKAGMTIRMEDGSLELVYDTTDSYGNPDLGINASNEDYLELHPFASREFYSLCNFDMPWDNSVNKKAHIHAVAATIDVKNMPLISWVRTPGSITLSRQTGICQLILLQTEKCFCNAHP